MKKILLIGSSSDICKQLCKDFKSYYEFLHLSSNNEESDYANFDVLNRQTYPEISDIDGIVYFQVQLILSLLRDLRRMILLMTTILT